MIKLLLAIAIAFVCPLSLAYERLDIPLDSATELDLSRFQAEGKTLLLWLPSEYGFGPGYIPVALDLEARGFDVWVTHLHETYMLPSGRHSLNEVDISDLSLLVEMARRQGFENLYLVSANRGVQLALQLAYQWQQKYPSSRFMRGHLFFSPHIVKGRTELGQTAEFVQLSAYSNLPIYLLQAQYSTKYAHSWSIARQLQQGGSPVFQHFIPGVQGGFQSRPDADLTEDDITMRGQLGGMLEQAISLLSAVHAAELKTGYQLKSNAAVSTETVEKDHVLQPYQGDKVPPKLRLADLSGRSFDLEDHGGQVVLINFWATWCGPCVKEIPSLSRLVKRLQGRAFDVIAVNIGEPADVIEEFLKEVPVNFDILLDTDGATVRDWKVYAYPSNFVIDRQGRIQYAYRGALEWDDPRVVSAIEGLIDQ